MIPVALIKFGALVILAMGIYMGYKFLEKEIAGKSRYAIIATLAGLALVAFITFNLWTPVYNKLCATAGSATAGVAAVIFIAILGAGFMAIRAFAQFMVEKTGAGANIGRLVDAGVLFCWLYLSLHLLRIGQVDDRPILAGVVVGGLLFVSLLQGTTISKWAKRIGGLAIALLTICFVFGLVAPDMRAGLKRASTAEQKKIGTVIHERGMRSETRAAMVQAVATEDAPFFVKDENSALQPTSGNQPRKLAKGSYCMVVDHNKELEIFSGQAYIKIRLPNPATGDFLRGEEYYAPARCFKWGSDVAFSAGRYSMLKSEKVWTVFFMTDEFVEVMENWKKGQALVFSGFNGNSRMTNGAGESKFPSSGWVKSAMDHPLKIKHHIGGEMKINIL